MEDFQLFVNIPICLRLSKNAKKDGCRLPGLQTVFFYY